MAATTCASVQLHSVSRWSLSFGKRSMDLLASTAGLIIGFPLIAAIAALIFLSSGRPIFFRQWRLGRDGQKFQLLKFRTMAANAKSHRVRCDAERRHARYTHRSLVAQVEAR